MLHTPFILPYVPYPILYFLFPTFQIELPISSNFRPIFHTFPRICPTYILHRVSSVHDPILTSHIQYSLAHDAIPFVSFDIFLCPTSCFSRRSSLNSPFQIRRKRTPRECTQNVKCTSQIAYEEFSLPANEIRCPQIPQETDASHDQRSPSDKMNFVAHEF